jgi:hypothetical protein
MKRAAMVGLAALLMGMLALPASADNLSEGFSGNGWSVGNPLVAANGWNYTGGSLYDIELVPSGIDGQSVRISNGVMDGSFGDWLFSKPLNTAATEGGLQEFSAEFDIASTSADEQPGLQISVAPQTAGGARMSFLKFRDTPAGIVVSFADVMNLDEAVGLYPAQEVWRDVDIATLTDRDATHRVRIVMDLIPGAHNDVVQVYIDGSGPLVPGRTGGATFDGFYAPVDNQPTINKAKAGQTIPLKWRLSAKSFATSWEDYYRFNTESNAGETQPFKTRQVDSLIFQARGDGTAPTDGGGFLIDNVAYSSTSTPTLPVVTQGVSDPSVYNTPPIKVEGENCGDLDGNIDPIEIFAANANGLMYHGNGVWQYNWKTPTSLAKHCVEVTLDPVGGSTLFKFTK